MNLTKKMQEKQTFKEFEKEENEIKMQQSLMSYEDWIKSLKQKPNI